MMIVMLSTFFKSTRLHRFLHPQRRRFRDRPAGKSKSERSSAKLLGFLFGGLLLASIVLLLSAALRGSAPEQSSHADTAPAGQTAATPSTDGRAVSELQEATAAERLPEPIIATIDRTCAAHAREKLMVGLTNYYLQRRLRPGATSDDAAETSSLTGVLAGPGDPVATTPDSSCRV